MANGWSHAHGKTGSNWSLLPGSRQVIRSGRWNGATPITPGRLTGSTLSLTLCGDREYMISLSCVGGRRPRRCAGSSGAGHLEREIWSINQMMEALNTRFPTSGSADELS